MKTGLRILPWITTVIFLFLTLYFYNKAQIYHDIAVESVKLSRSALNTAQARCHSAPVPRLRY